MRPRRLVVSAFGPYATEQVFDFDDLKGNNFFLICGPTGSGKTSVLDAICYALYGDSSGAERAGRTMRSDHASPATETSVLLDFELGKKSYRITRKPEQERPKKRGEGTTTQPATATTWDRTEAADADDEGKVIASQPRSVNEASERLLGFKSEQFRQVVMLPQGQFQTFLKSKSDERQKILERLFGTEFYRRIEDALKDAARGIGNDIKTVRDRRDAVLEDADASDLDSLVDRQGKRERALTIAERRLEQIRNASRRANEDVTQASRVEDQFVELEKATNYLAELERKKAAIAEDRETLADARRADSLLDVETSAQEAEAELAQAKAHVKKAEGDSVVRAKELRAAAAEKAKAEESRPKIKELERTLEHLKQHKNALERVKDTEDEISNLDSLITKLVNTQEHEDTELSDLQLELEDSKNKLRDAHTLEKQLESLQEACTALGKTVKQREQSASTQKELKESQRALTTAERELIASERELNASKSEYEDIEHRWRAGQASVLASHLKRGEPCPVCGSTDHPVHATASKTVPSDERLAVAKGAHEKVQKVWESLTREMNVKRGTVRALETKEASLLDGLGDDAQSSVHRLNEELDSRLAMLREAKGAGMRIVRIAKTISKAEATQAELKKSIQSRAKEIKRREGEQDKLRGNLDARLSGIPAQLRSVKGLRDASAKAAATLTQLQTAIDEAIVEHEDANKAASDAEAGRKAAVQQLGKAERQRAAKAEQFGNRLSAQGFATIEQFQKARRTKTDIRTLESWIKKYDAAMSAAEARVKRATQQTEELKRPDLAAIKARAERIDRIRERSLGQAQSIEQELRSIRKWTLDLKSLDSREAKLDKEFRTIGYISELADGKNSRKMTFQRFVLAALLDDVLRVASRRLEVMSKGRYRIERTTRQLDLRSSGGLDLEVHDAHTGRNRAVNTLSGGESFLASLALALGLSDVVQAYAGGIVLDTIFVDEGFGSLDPEALDLAINTLLDLQAQGRLVGVISHVPDLKERIDVRLEIESSRTGSTARFVA